MRSRNISINPRTSHFGASHDATDGEKNQISKWVDAAGDGNRDAYLKAMEAIRSINPWGGSSWAPISLGGWYAYSELTTMMSTTIPERHPGWVTAVGTIVGSVADVVTVGQMSQATKNMLTSATVATGGKTIQSAVDTVGGVAQDTKKAACDALPFKKWNPSSLSCEGDVPWKLIIISATVIIGGITTVYLFGPVIRGVSKIAGRKLGEYRRKKAK